MTERAPSATAEASRRAYEEYAKAVACFELGVELLPEALARSREALRLYGMIPELRREDELACRELERLIEQAIE